MCGIGELGFPGFRVKLFPEGGQEKAPPWVGSDRGTPKWGVFLKESNQGIEVCIKPILK